MKRHHNLTRAELIEESVRRGLGNLNSWGSLMVSTGKHTGRAVKDRFIVQYPSLKSTISWNATNVGIDPDKAKRLFSGVESKLDREEVFSMSAFVGPFPIEVISTSPWHILFAQNMFRSTPTSTLGLPAAVGENKIRIFHAPYAKPQDFGIEHSSETLLVLDPVEMKVALVGSAYAGEIKKSAFTLCNYKMPEWGIFPMHASANCLEDGSQSCVLFGLSGTGKTTLSASPDRALIGDDEIVWSLKGLSNLEGGCYAKLIDLSREREPEIFSAVHRFGAIMENVGYDAVTREVCFDDRSKTENTRGSYPLEFLPKIFPTDREAQAPSTIVFLMADAFGAMPAVAKLNPIQAAYYFISGYTAKVAGTELGVKEPQAAFSTCFGAPFMPRPSAVYAKLLAEKIEASKATVWLLNTGWTEGGYGKGERFPIPVSRRLLSAIQNRVLEQQKTVRHPVFGFEVPLNCSGVDSKILRAPEGDCVRDLALKFKKNAELFSHLSEDIIKLGGPA